MRIPTWRLALTGAAIVILLAMGVGLVLAASSPQPSSPLVSGPVSAAAPAASGVPSTAAAKPRLRQRLQRRIARIGPVAGRFVDGTLNFIDKDGNLVTFQLDHGTIALIGTGSITISEAGGKQVTVATDASTVVRLGGGAGLGKVSDLKVGDQIFVQSRLDGGTALAKHILRVPAAKAGSPASSGATAPSATGG